MNIEGSAVRDELHAQLGADPEGMIDLTRLWQAAGRPRSLSPLKWVTWTGLKPGVTALGGLDDEVWADQGTARDYAHFLDRGIEPGRITLAQLRKRGWAEPLVQAFLPDCDATMNNRHYKTGAPIRLYLLERVEAIEASDEFRTASSGAKPRRTARARSADFRKARVQDWLDKTTIPVPRMDWNTLIEKSYKHQDHLQARSLRVATREARPELLERVVVTYLRYLATLSVRRIVRSRSGGVARLARKEFDTKVYEAIAEAYPQLSGECDRRRRERDRRAEWE